MTQRKTTKRALIASVLSLLVCVSMLIGSTFAWFTDTATTGVNTIQAGNLDIAFMMKTVEDNTDTEADETKWETAEGKTLNFTNADGEINILWEPGATFALPTVKLVNNGNLAFEFKMFINSIAGGDMKLAEVLEVIVNNKALTKADGVTPVTLKDIMAEADGAAHGIILPTGSTNPNDGYTTVGESIEYTIALHMQEEAGNEYQKLSITGLALTAYANQYIFEKDSFNDQYDKDASVDFTELTGENAKNLTGNITVSNLSANLTTDAPDFAIGDANLKASGVTEIAFNGGVINAAYMTNPTNNSVWPISYKPNGSKINLNVPKNTKLVFRNVTVNGFYNFHAYQITDGISIEFIDCTLNGCWASGHTGGLENITFKNCRFTLNGIKNLANIKNTNPLWLGPAEGQTLTLDGCTIDGNRPIKYAGDQNGTRTGDWATLNVTNCVFNLTATEYDTNASRLDRLTAVRFDDDITTVNVKNNIMNSGYAFYQTDLAPYSNADYSDSNNTKPATALWRVEY